MSKNCCNVRKLNWAAPSWVIPGTVAANAEFLADKAPEICLCLFETQACLAYGSEHLPKTIGKTTWHAHLPIDLPWQEGADAVAAICAELCAKISHLHPRAAVLHCPPGDNATRRKTLARFSQIWESGIPIALENTSVCDVLELGQDFLQEVGFAFCLDVAHAMSYGQWELLTSDLVEQARLWHWSAPGNDDKHWPLARLNDDQKRLGQQLLARSRPDAIHLLEIFSWPGVECSARILEAALKR